MKRYCVLLIVAMLCSAGRLPANIDYIDGESVPRPSLPGRFQRLISPVGDIRAILGTQGKNICVSEDGYDIAVIYGDPTPDPDNYMEVKIAYSTDGGFTWTTYGPYSPEVRRMYASVDGLPDFDDYPEHLWFAWHESPSGYATGSLVVMNFAGYSTTLADSVFPWLPCIAVNPENPMHLVVTAWSYLAAGNYWAYCWISTDGGYTWTDTIPMCAIDLDGACGHLRFGPNDYLFYTYHDSYDWNGISIIYPYYIESTDGGYTWGAETPLPEVPLLQADAQFWWHELDCEVINGEPWAVHNDINQVFPDSADMWVFHGTGSPGSWTWDITQVGSYGNFVVTIADTTYAFAVGQYPSISVDYSNTKILIGYKANCLIATSTDTVAYGPHIAGIYTNDNGVTWHSTHLLSDPQVEQVIYGDWNATEIAHRGFNPYYLHGQSAHCIWVHESQLNLYYERRIPANAIEDVIDIHAGKHLLSVMPSITQKACHVSFTTRHDGTATMRLFDATGRCVDTCFEGYLDTGMHNVDINTQNLSNGTYFVVLESSSQKQVAKCIVAK